ncbi:MAG: GTPase-associated protein 1-related protein [Streptosporangiaceae bacterium]
MTVLQLHYTSCESGLSGHSGFQFCAMTPGVAQAALREVEQLTAYEPPDHLQAAPEAGAGEHPVNLVHTQSEHNGSTIIAQVVFTGLDFSNRSGNYFAHTLVIDAPEDALEAVLPVELWAAPFWRSAQGSSTELPPLPGPLDPGPITPELITDFLTGTPDHVRQLESLLAAADKAMDGGRRVLLVGTDSAAVCHWIAAACYLLGPVLGRQLTFATYSHDPRRCLTHVVGAIANDLSEHLETAAFYTFDLTAGTIRGEVPPSPAAALLARAGLARSGALWATAASLSPLPGSLSESFPVLASAALVLDHSLEEQEAEAAIGWLAAPGNRVSTEQQASAVHAVLRQARHNLPVHRQAELVGMAVTADAAGTPGTDTLASEVECAFVDDFFARLDHGVPPGAWTGCRTERGRKAAADGCVQLLPGARPDVALGLLNWARKAKLRLLTDVVRQTGRDVIMSAVLAGTVPRGLAQTAPAWQALRLGMLDGLQGLAPHVQQTVFSRLGLDLFLQEDLEAYPELTEHWIIDVATRGKLSNVEALIRVVDLRRGQGHIPALDDYLLQRLWPSKGWGPAEAAEIVARLPPGELGAGSAPQRCAAILYDFPRVYEVSEWMTFVSRLSQLPARFVDGHGLSLARQLEPAIRLIKQVADIGERPSSVINRLLRMAEAPDKDLRVFFNWQLPPMLLRYSSLDYALTVCSEELLDHFCVHAREKLETGPGETLLAARLFVLMTKFKRKGQTKQAEYLEEDVLAQVVPGWHGGRRKEVSQHVSRLMANGSKQFDLWLEGFPGDGQLGGRRGQRSTRASRRDWARIFRSLFRP